jgi:uncharacterized membrane protein YgcG
LRADLNAEGYTVRDLGGGDFSVNIHRTRPGEVVVSEVEVNTFTITASSGTGGTINPSGVLTLIQGKDQTFNIAPHTGYVVTDVIVDGASIGAAESYTFSNVSSNHTIAASFIRSASGDGDGDGDSNGPSGVVGGGGSSGGGCFINT